MAPHDIGVGGTAAQGVPSGKDVSAYSPLQAARLDYKPPLPAVLRGSYDLKRGPPTSAAGNPDHIEKLFPHLFGQPSLELVASGSNGPPSSSPLRIAAVLSGGQAPGGHNVIAGMFDFLQERAPGSTLVGFLGGPAGIMNNKAVEITAEFLYPYRNQGGFDIICSGRDKIETPEQFLQAEETCRKLDLDGLVVIGGDDSNTNACLLAEYMRKKEQKVKVIGCPKTIDGDLKAKQVPTSFGFDTACKIYAEEIGNVMLDARSSRKYYHFVRLMGRAASHITLECALQTHPNVALIGEEVSVQKQTLQQVTNAIADVVCKRHAGGRDYGVVLIPEGLIDFIPEINSLIGHLNEILAGEGGGCDEEGRWKDELAPDNRRLFDSLPPAIQEELLFDRDPHGNVQVAKIETEKMLIQMVDTELARRGEEYGGAFQGQAHFFGYEGRCGMPTNFDANYCYALGFAAGALLANGATGVIASVGNLTGPPEDWTVGGTALTDLMDVERRKGKFKPVIKKAMVDLDGAPFKKFATHRDKWAEEDHYRTPGPIQFSGPTADAPTFTLLLEQGVIS